MAAFRNISLCLCAWLLHDVNAVSSPEVLAPAMEIDAAGEIVAASDDGMMRKRRAGLAKDPKPSAKDTKLSVKSTSSISADGGVESGADGTFKAPEWIKEKAEKILPDGAGSDARDAENGLLDAVSKESQGTSTAQAAADNMVQAVKKKAADILKTTQADVNKAVDSTRQFVTDESQHAVNHLKQAKEKEDAFMQEAKAKLANATDLLGKASLDEEVFIAINASTESANVAAKKSAEIKLLYSDVKDTVEASVAKIRNKTAIAAAAIDASAKQALAETIIIADGLKQVGVKASEKMQAKDEASQIVDKTTTVSEDIKATAQSFVYAATQAAEALKAKGDEVAKKLVLDSDTDKSKGFANSKRLGDAATKAKKQLDESKKILVAGDSTVVQALQAVTDMSAGTVIPAADESDTYANADGSSFSSALDDQLTSDQKYKLALCFGAFGMVVAVAAVASLLCFQMHHKGDVSQLISQSADQPVSS